MLLANSFLGVWIGVEDVCFAGFLHLRLHRNSIFCQKIQFINSSTKEFHSKYNQISGFTKTSQVLAISSPIKRNYANKQTRISHQERVWRITRKYNNGLLHDKFPM